MAFHTSLRRALSKNLPNRVVYMKDWKVQQRVNWRGTPALPVALMLHHTAGAATESTNPKAKGNQKSDNNGVINYIQNHFPVPAANFTLDRDGTVYVHSAYPVWHAGVGSFKKKFPWEVFGIPDNMGNDYLLGVEIMSKGKKKDFTAAQKSSLDKLMEACGVAAKWPEEKRKADVRHPRHKDWTRRKPDILYEQAEVNRWLI